MFKTMKTWLTFLSVFLHLSSCRDFYVGMFKKNDFLVAQDTLYKEKTPFKSTYAKYGRLFKCPITYFRVVDRLGVGKGPRVQITRGGIQKKYLTLNIISMYNQPVSVNIYVGCANNLPSTTTTTTKKEEKKIDDKDTKEEKTVTKKEEEVATGGEKVTTDETAQATDSGTTPLPEEE